MWVLLRPPRFGGAKHAIDYDNRSRHRRVGISGPRRRRGRTCGYPPSAQASLCSGGLSEGAAMPGWYRGVAAPINPTHVKKALANPEPCTHGALSRHSNPSDEYPLLMVDRV